MATVEFAPETADDFARIIDYLNLIGATRPRTAITRILNALRALEANPGLGRLAGGTRRELVIGRGVTGYLALYEYLAELDLVLILAVRSQREQRYRTSRTKS